MVGCSPARQAWARPLRQVATARGKRGRCGPRSRRWRGGRRTLLTIRGPGGPSGGACLPALCTRASQGYGWPSIDAEGQGPKTRADATERTWEEGATGSDHRPRATAP